MSEYICFICLRTDRTVNLIEDELAQIHDEICDFSLSILDPHYCFECEYLLRKLYNFKTKCVMSYKIYEKWRKSEVSARQPIQNLCELLPNNCLNTWKAKNTKLYSCTYPEDLICLRRNDTNIIRVNEINNTKRESSQYIQRLEINVIRDNVLRESIVNEQREESNIIRENEFTNVLRESIENIQKEDIKGCLPQINFDTLDLICDEQKIYLLNEDEIKSESDNKESNPFQDLLKNERTHVEELWTNDDDIKNDTNDSSDYSKKIDTHKDGCINIKDELIQSKDISKNDKVNRRLINSNKNKINKRIKKVNDEINDSHSHDEKLINSKIKKTLKKKKVKDNVTSENDGEINKRIKKINDEINDSDSDDEILNDLINKKRRKNGDGPKSKAWKGLRFHTRRDILSCKRKKNGSYSIDRLKAELVSKFETCGEIKTEEGDIIDTNLILNCLDDKVTETILTKLWKAVYGKNDITPRARQLFRSIQNKFKNNYETVFDIEYLNTKEKIVEEFERRKTYECFINAEFKCDICYQGFKHEKKLEYHRKCHDESTGNFPCTICSVRHKSKKALINHVNTNHEAVYKCKLCPLITYYKASMVNHYKLHKGVKFRCEQCDVTFKSKSSYNTHTSYRHQLEHVCTSCGRGFATETGLKWHTTRAHEGKEPTNEGAAVKCEQCELTFPSQEVCAKHVQISHKTTRDPKNKMRLPRLSPNKKHKLPSLITCRVCNAKGRYGWLVFHFKAEHPDVDMNALYADTKTHLCDICGHGFTSVYQLRDHMNKHTGTRPYACPTCSKRFHALVTLRNHRLLHLPKQQECKVCGKMFHSPANLFNHMRIHTRDRKYKCHICTKGFLHRVTLNEHINGVHYNIRREKKKTPRRGGNEHWEGGKRPTSTFDSDTE